MNNKKIQHAGKIFFVFFFLWATIGFSNTARAQGSRGITIISPEDGATFAPGDSFTVQVQPTEGFPLEGAMLVADSHFETIIKEPFNFDLTVPDDAVGIFEIAVLGRNSAKAELSGAEISLNIQPTAALKNLMINHRKENFHNYEFGYIGQMDGISVYGNYADGIERDLKRFKTTYTSSNEAVVTVNSDGLIKAEGEGTATIFINHEDLEKTVTIVVELPENITAPIAVIRTLGSSFNGGKTVHLYGHNSADLELDPLTYQWTQIDPSALTFPVTLSDPTSMDPTFTAPNEDVVLTFQLVVNDGKFTSEPVTMDVTITKPD